MINTGEIILYKNTDGTIKLDVQLLDETVWLNRNQMAVLFNRDVKTIGKHINNIFNEGELQEISTIAKFATVQNEDSLDKPFCNSEQYKKTRTVL